MTIFYTFEDIEVLMLREFEKAHKENDVTRMADLSTALDILREVRPKKS